jgi:uncharacterized glyoxalase superfamily protein PhnB
VKQVFAATGDFRKDGPSEITIGDSLVMISNAGLRDSLTAFLYAYGCDTDETYRRALDAGAMSLESPQDTPHGDRCRMVKDRWGDWHIVTRRPCWRTD